MPPTTGGEGMTDSPYRDLSRAGGHPAMEPADRTTPDGGHKLLSALNIPRRTAPASRTYGRYAVGLRPILDPDTAGSTRPTVGRTRPKEDRSRQATGVTRPHSFRNARPASRRPWADAGLLTDVAAGRPPHALARHVGTRPPHVACAHVGVSQPAGEKRPSARTPAGPGPRRSVAARPIAQARTRSRLICERGACAYQLRKPGQEHAADLRWVLCSNPAQADRQAAQR